MSDRANQRVGLALGALLMGLAVYLAGLDRDEPAQEVAPAAEANTPGKRRADALTEDDPFPWAEAERARQRQRLLQAFYALAQPGGPKGVPPYAEFVAGLNAENLSLFLELLDEITGASYVIERSRLQLAIAHRWASFDRPAALRYATSLPPRTRNTVLSALVVSWAELDRDAAWRYVEGALDLHAGDPAFNVAAELLASVGSRDPAWALERLKALPAGRAAEQAAERLFAAQAAVDVERAAAWLDQLPPELHDHAFHSILLHYGASDPRRALDAFAGLSLPPEKLHRSASRLTSVWAAESPAAVATWLEHARESPLFPSVASTLAERWSYEDFEQAARWLTGHRDDRAYLPALKSHLVVLAAQNPDAASRWIDSIQDAENRGALLVEMERLGLTPPAPTF